MVTKLTAHPIATRTLNVTAPESGTTIDEVAVLRGASKAVT
jgi:hypothetical protein